MSTDNTSYILWCTHCSNALDSCDTLDDLIALIREVVELNADRPYGIRDEIETKWVATGSGGVMQGGLLTGPELIALAFPSAGETK